MTKKFRVDVSVTYEMTIEVKAPSEEAVEAWFENGDITNEIEEYIDLRRTSPAEVNATTCAEIKEEGEEKKSKGKKEEFYGPVLDEDGQLTEEEE